jgi:hypothetical protein
MKYGIVGVPKVNCYERLKKEEEDFDESEDLCFVCSAGCIRLHNQRIRLPDWCSDAWVGD